MEVSCQLHTPAALTRGSSHWYPLYRTRGGTQNQPESFGDEKNFRPLSEIKPPIFGRPDRGFVTVVTEQSRLSSLHSNYVRNFVRFFLHVCTKQLICGVP
jgi:hypothetical protein